MKIKITKSFSKKFNKQIDYIAADKPQAAKFFKNKVIEAIREVPSMPYKHRQSIFFNALEIRDLIIQGYIIVYRINKKEDCIEVFGFSKWEENPYQK